MNISYNWLKEYVDFDLTPDEVAAALTSIGLETGGVEEVQTIKGGLEGLVVGEVLTCEPHPNSDHMHITTVNLGQGEPVQIVCGAANVAAGQKVIVATLGTKLYDGDECFTIKKSKLRGVESNGMICAEDEIGVGTSHEGIIVLPADVVPGTLAKDYYNVKSEYVLEVDITPNRADACSHYGVARDLYAWLIQNGHKATLKRPSVDAFKVDNHDMNIDIVVENTEACPRYAGVAIKGVTVKESPEWLQNKLRLIGVRPINNIVDITNYILHAYGQPMHCFDADKIKGGKIVVKTCAEGTPFVTLDEVERKLSDKDLMICNAEEPMCIAGVFGGLDSGTTETTTDVFLESAYFHPTWVRKTARRHGLSTDSSFRFERGIDPNITIYALKEAALLVKELATQDGQKENKFTIPEGYTIEMTASKLEKEGIMSAQEFLTAVTNAAVTSKYKDVLPKKKKVFYQLQGYIYPDTYYLAKDITGDQLVAKILDEFDKKFDATRQEKAKKLGMTVEEVLIRASLLQKETELPGEYPIIAGVIQNRLDKKMKLQFDSTAVYAITKGQYGIARVMYKDLKVDSPYNTYKHKGLPVGPICSPSLEAIDGVLNPQKNDYLYFQMDTVKNDGSNIFSKTYEEHKAASATTEAAAETTTTAAKQKTKKK